MQTDILDNLRNRLSAKGVLVGTDVHPGYYTDPRDIGAVKPDVVLRPASTAELSQIISICHAASQRRRPSLTKFLPLPNASLTRRLGKHSKPIPKAD